MNLKKYPLIHFLLAVTVLVSSLAWAPMTGAYKDPQPSDPCAAAHLDEATAAACQASATAAVLAKRKVNLGAWIEDKEVFITGDNFPLQRRYKVLVSRNGRAWTRVGYVRSTDTGLLNDAYKLPKWLRGEKYLTVCLQDMKKTVKSHCAQARRMN